MTEQLKQTGDSKTLDLGVLALVAFTMLCGYFLTRQCLLWTHVLRKELFGIVWIMDSLPALTGGLMYSADVVVILVVSFLIRYRFRFHRNGSLCILMVLGCGLKYYAVLQLSPERRWLWALKLGGMLAALGYAIFGVGVEIAGMQFQDYCKMVFKGKG